MEKVSCRTSVGKPEKDHFEDFGLDGRIILIWVIKKWDWAWTTLIWLRTGQVAGFCKYGNKLLGSVKCGEIDCLNPFSFSRRSLLHKVR
jgi:hypothetical protein